MLWKLGPLTGQEKILFWSMGGPDGQMPTIYFPLQIRLGEIKAAVRGPEGIRRILEDDIIFIQTNQGQSSLSKNSGKIEQKIKIVAKWTLQSVIPK